MSIEIAVSICRTARRLGIHTVAVYSEADARHVAAADAAVCIGPEAPRQSYLDIDKVISAACASGAVAVHPGYGFLSEDARFAGACRAAGLIFVGPSVEVIETMGSKLAPKARMQAAGIALLPGYDGQRQDLSGWKHRVWRSVAP